MRRILTGLMAAALLSSTSIAAGLGEMTAAERAAFRAEVRSFLIENPDVIVEALDALRARDALAASQRESDVLRDQAAAIFNDPDSWVGGNPDGDITVVEFIDYRCSYCRKAQNEVTEMVASDGNIRLVIKEFPILGEDSVASSRFAIAVRQLHGDEAYKNVHDALITLRGGADPETLRRLATDLGLDAPAILERMASDQVTQIIAANHALASLLEITGTPTFVIDQTLVRGYIPLDAMRQVVTEQRAG